MIPMPFFCDNVMTGSKLSNNKKGINAAMLGNNIQAESFFRKAIVDGETAIEGSMNLIRLLHMQDRHADAISTYNELEMKLQPEKIHPQILYIVSQSSLQVGYQKLAIRNLSILAQQNPGDSEIVCLLSKSLIEIGRLTDSKRILEQAIQYNLEDPSIVTQLAITESELGNYEIAEQLHKQLIRKYSNTFLSHYNYGLFLLNLGDKERALCCFERCKQIVPNAPEVQEQIDKLFESERDTLTDIYQDIEREQWEEAKSKLRENQESIEPTQFWAAVNELPKEQQRKFGEIEHFNEEVQIEVYELYTAQEKEKVLNELVDIIKNTGSLIWNRAGKPTRYGYQSHEILNGNQSPIIQDLCKRLKVAVDDFTKNKPLLHRIRAQKRGHIELSGWSVVLKKRGHQKRHIHPESVVSGVFYIQLPAESADEYKKEGNLVFPSNNMKIVTPKEGTAVLFPSYLAHETIPINSNEERICIAFNWT